MSAEWTLVSIIICQSFLLSTLLSNTTLLYQVAISFLANKKNQLLFLIKDIYSNFLLCRYNHDSKSETIYVNHNGSNNQNTVNNKLRDVGKPAKKKL